MNLDKNRLEELRNELNYKAKDLANITNVNKSTYSEWEHSKIPIPTKRLIEFADFYNINIDYILNLTSDRLKIRNQTNIDLEKIGKRLKDIRNKMDLTLRNLANELNCSFSALASYERGEKLINSEILIKFAKLSGASIDYILGRI